MSEAMPHHILTVLVENKAGVLSRVAGLFSRRGFNIFSLAVSPTDDERFSRMTIVVDAETAPLDEPELYQYDLDLGAIAEVWRRGSVIASWLLDLTASALLKDPELSSFAGRVSDSGEGRWTIKAAIDEGVPAHILTAALYERFSSRGEADFADKLLSAMRYEFGGHIEKK